MAFGSLQYQGSEDVVREMPPANPTETNRQKKVRKPRLVKICKFKICERRSVSLGFCATHRRQFNAGWLTPEGEKTPLWKQRCNRRCAANNCPKGPAYHSDGYCKQHFSDIKAGIKVERRSCKVCGDDKKLWLGFCTAHYKNYRVDKLIDINGNEIRDRRKRIYAPDQQCKVSQCKFRPRARAFCSRHYAAFRAGTIDERGRILKKTEWYYTEDSKCIFLKCTKKPHSLGYCRSHYDKLCRGTLHRKIQRDFPCSAVGCKEQAYSKGLCKHHARKLRYILNRQQELASQSVRRQQRRVKLKQTLALEA